jgi:hypothetical protein
MSLPPTDMGAAVMEDDSAQPATSVEEDFRKERRERAVDGGEVGMSVKGE